MPKFLAIYTGDPHKPGARPDDQVIAEGMKAWGDWMARYASRIIDAGGPLGATKKVTSAGVEDTHNAMAAYVIVEAEDHETAAQMFIDHPHFRIFPGLGVEVMPCLPVPSAP